MICIDFFVSTVATLSTHKLAAAWENQQSALGEHKDADQLRSNCEADQRLCFRYTDSTIPLLFIAEISSL